MTAAWIMGLRYAGPAGWVAGGAWITASTLAVVLLFRAAVRPSTSWDKLAKSTIACTVVGLAASGFLLADARRRMLTIALGLEDPMRDWPDQVNLRWFDAFEITEITLFDAGVGLSFCAVLLALCAVLTVARAEGRRSAPLRLALVLTAAALATTIGLDAARMGLALASELSKTGAHVTLQESLARATNALLAGARVHVMAVATIGSVAAAGASLHAGERPFGHLPAIGAWGTFVLGLLAFTATRGMAHDARNPIPSDQIGYLGCPVSSLDPHRLPAVAGGEMLTESSLLELRPGGASFASRGWVGNPGDLAELLRQQRDYWTQATRRPASDMRPVLVVAPERLSTEEAAIWLRAIEEHLVRGFILVVIEPERRFPTRTLGEVAGTPHCGGIRMSLDPAGPLLTSYPTWGDLVRGGSDPRAPISIRLH